MFLHELGWEVDPVCHPGFSGRLHPVTVDEGQPVAISGQIPLQPFPYYADTTTEIAFVLPIQKPSASDSTSSIRSIESSDSGQESSSLASTGETQSLPPPHLSFPAPISIPTWSAPSGSGVQESSVYAGIAEQERPSSLGKKGAKPTTGATSQHIRAAPYSTDSLETPKRRTAILQDCAVMVVWLEKFEDHLQFPAEPLSHILHRGRARSSKSGNCILPVIFIHQLASGLYQTVIKADERWAIIQ